MWQFSSCFAMGRCAKNGFGGTIIFNVLTGPWALAGAKTTKYIMKIK
jgi:hypothetical protein